MHIPKPIRDNLGFLVGEVHSQVEGLQSFLGNGSPAVAQRILGRSGYALNLKSRIHDSCVQHLACNKTGMASADRSALRSMEIIATQLERISERCRDCITQLDSVNRDKLPELDQLEGMLEEVSDALLGLGPAVDASNTEPALALGAVEDRLDQHYASLFKSTVGYLKKKKHTEDLVISLFVAQAISRMGDYLRGASEAILSANLGYTVNTERYQTLQNSIAQLDRESPSRDLTIEPVAQTRSGSRISGIADPDDPEEGFLAIYKDGEKRKLKEEVQGVESWHEIYPGLAPRILSYKKHGKTASLLVEHLAGLTMEQIVLYESESLLDEALEQLSGTLKSVWKETRRKKSVPACFIRQTRERLADVYAVHPEFRRGNAAICGVQQPSFEALLDQAEALEKQLHAPFSVYIHGDFNVDNILYDPQEQRINFIDLHRSRYMDYVQDVSVFMVSNYRLQVLDVPLRQRIMELARDFYVASAKFARKSGDETFELRLALGLARSFATSTRFILDKTLSRRMFLRARFLLEQVLSLPPRQAAAYRIPIEELFIG